LSKNLFFVSNPNPGFLGIKADKPKIDIYLLGVPFDSGVSWRPGTRFGPQAIREASLNIETFSYRYSFDATNLRIEDLGDISVVHGDSAETLRRVELTIKEIEKDAPLVLIGGEHTMTLAAVKALKPDFFVVFDAHTDLRDDYLGFRLSHASVSRRISEIIEPKNILQVGIRASCTEELEYASKNRINILNSVWIHNNGLEETKKVLKEKTSQANRIYVSVDLDVLDPSCMPGVGNPEAEGLTTHELITFLDSIVDKRLIGFDIMELNPLMDPSGISAVTATRILLEVLIKSSISRT
jgi:agmatinase